jgi:hypothetical protein
MDILKRSLQINKLILSYDDPILALNQELKANYRNLDYLYQIF